MEIVIVGILSSIFTRLAGKLKVSKTYLSIGICIVLGAGYYFATTYYAVEREALVKMLGGVYASSQLVYNIAKKLGLIE